MGSLIIMRKVVWLVDMGKGTMGCFVYLELYSI